MKHKLICLTMVLLLIFQCGCSSKILQDEYEPNGLINVLETGGVGTISAIIPEETIPKSFQSSQADLITTYGEVVIDEPYFWNNTKAVSFNAAYPVFTDPQLTILNNAITDEVQSWYKIYDAICMFAYDECSHNDKLASLGRHITTSYTVEETDDHLNVKFRVDYFMKLSNMEYWYEITFTYDFEFRMLYETITTMRRIYG